MAFSTQEASAEALLSKADTAMYFAKAAGKNRFLTFEPLMHEMLQEKTRLVADIARAIANEEFFVEYQPIVDLGTRSLLGVEALVRWRHPELGVLLPGPIHPDRRGMRSDHQALDAGCWGGRAAMCVPGAASSPVAEGLLRRRQYLRADTFRMATWARDVAHVLKDSGLEPGNLVIELTESTIMHNTETNLARLQELKALGVRLAIDDFGTGYSSPSSPAPLSNRYSQDRSPRSLPRLTQLLHRAGTARAR